MALRCVGDQCVRTAANRLLFGATSASLSMWVRINPGSGANNGDTFLFGHRDFDSAWALIEGDGAKHSILAGFRTWDGPSIDGSFFRFVGAVPGVSYHLALVADAGTHRFYVNGVQVGWDATPAGIIAARPNPPGQPDRAISIGLETYGNAPGAVDVTIDEPTLWEGYALTAGDLTALRERSAHPEAIAGDKIAWRLRFDGPDGMSALLGDGRMTGGGAAGPGVAEIVGAPTYVGGVLSYAPPSRVRSVRVGPSRKTVVVLFEDASGREAFVARLGDAAPTLTVGGGAPIDLGTPCWGAGGNPVRANPPYAPFLLYVVDDPIPVGAAATISAPEGWATTVAGEVGPLAAVPVDTSAVATLLPAFDPSPKAMGAGYNLGAVSNTPVPPYANLMKAAPSRFYFPRASVGYDGRGYPDDFGTVSGGGAPPYLLCPVNFSGMDGRDDPDKGYASIPASGVYTLRWTGTATLWLGADPAGSSCADIGIEAGPGGVKTRRYQVDVAPPSYAPALTVYADSPAFDELALYPPGVDPDDPPKFRPEFLRMLAGSRSIRFMDAQKTNNSGYVDFSELPGTSLLSYHPDTGDERWIPVQSIGPADNSDGYFFPSTVPILLTFAAPHGIKDGQVVYLSGESADFPGPSSDGTFPTTGGRTVSPRWTTHAARVLSPTTVSIYLFPSTPASGDTLAGTYSGAAIGAGNVRLKVYRAMPLEDMVDLANTVGAEPWFSVPHCATDAFVTSFFDYVARHLDAGQACRVEYSNECWNYGPAFVQSNYCDNRGRIVPVVGSAGVHAEGSGYTSAPTVSFSGGGGSGAAAHAVVSGGRVVDVVLDDYGSGYTSAPTVTLSGGGGSGATAWCGRGLGGRAYYAKRSAEVHALARAAFVAAGRPASDVVRVFGTQAGYPGGVTAPIVDYCKRHGLPIDELAPAPYLSNRASGFTGSHEPTLVATFDRLDVDRALDLLELWVQYGQYGRYVSEHRPYLDAAGYAGTRIACYEGGPENGLPGWSAPSSASEARALTRRAQSVWRHPRARGVMLHFLQVLEDAGASLFVDFMLAYVMHREISNGYYVYFAHWAAYYSFDMRAGLGDGTDGLFDNRADAGDQSRLVSVVGGALATWMSLSGPSGPETPPQRRISRRWLPGRSAIGGRRRR